MLRLRCFLAFSFASLFMAHTAHATQPGYYTQPALRGDRLVFSSEGDLWTVTLPANIAPGAKLVAHRLTSSAGREGRVQIGGDGSFVAFSAAYDGNVDVYTMPIDGGAPKRLTFHPDSDLAVGVSADGRSVLFTSSRAQPLGRRELWSVPVEGGTPSRFNFGECSMASMSSTGKRIVFTRWSTENWNWKRYRGGTAAEIWIGDLAVGSFENISNNKAGDQFPMWMLGRVFFASDRTGVVNIFSMQPDGSDVKQHTNFAYDAGKPTAIEGYDVRWPNAEARRDGTRIVFCQAGQIALFDAVSGGVTRLNIELASDRVAERQRFTAGLEHVTGFDVSPAADQLVVGMRGELMVFPVKGGAPAHLTRTSFAREGSASFLDDDTVLLITDASGEQQIAAVPADGSDLPGLITSDREDWLFSPVASPDGNSVAFADQSLRLHMVDLNTLVVRQIDQSDVGEITDYRFSPDGQWLAYVKPTPSGYRQICLYALRTSKIVPIGEGMFDDFEPRWDPAGKYLYFLSKRRFAPVVDEFDYEYILMGSTGVFAIPLMESTPPPMEKVALAAGFDLEAWGSAPEPAEALAGEDEEAADGAPPVPAPIEVLQIDTEDIANRIAQLPIKPGEIEQLEAVFGGVCYATSQRESLLDDDWGEAPSLMGELTLLKLDLAGGADEPETLAEGIAGYVISRNCSTACWPTEAGFHLHDLTGAGDAEGEDVEIGEVQLRVDVRSEWQHIFNESWRLQRDFFWAPNMIGLDWDSVRAKYEALLPRVGDREELNDLIGEMIGELGNSHAYIWGGDEFQQATPVSVGLLGADVSSDAGGALKIERIIEGPSWDERVRSPLQLAHLKVKAGQYITAINGVQLERRTNPYDLLQDLADKPATLTIAEDATGRNARMIEVTLIGDESQLRYMNWIDTNRRIVAEATNGSAGYLHIPDMGGEGLSMFSQQFFPQSRMSALLIDVRDNDGGFVSQMILERLARTIVAYDQPRNGQTERYPFRAMNAHMVCLMDEHAGSDGDIFPAAFRKMALGPLIGTRTWGGVVGIRGDKMFVDFGLSTQPEYAWWEAETGWSIENVGVTPDIEVEITPADRVAGRDPQLDRAIAELKKKLEEDPKKLPGAPDWPDRSKVTP